MAHLYKTITMEQSDNLISVILPTYNRENLTARAIQSVLSQTYEKLELLVIDDASCDDTVETVLRYDDNRVQLHKHSTNKGGSAARNTGIRHADGDFIAFIDSDDVWEQSKLQTQLKFYHESPPDVIGTYCDINQRPAPTSSDTRKFLRRIDSVFNLEAQNQSQYKNQTHVHQNYEEILTTKSCINGSSSLLFESDSVKKVGGFDPRFECHQDWEFLIRILQTGKIGYIDETLVTKFGGGNASPETIKRAKQLFLRKFSNLIREKERDGVPVREIHQKQLANQYLADGQLLHALLNLYNGSGALTKSDVPTFVRSFIRGMVLD